MADEDPKPLPLDVKRAEAAMLRRRLVVSGNRYQARLVWTLQPWSEKDLRAEIGVEGSPFTVLEVEPLGRSAITWPGAPYWAQYAYLLMVEVHAIGLG